VNRAGGAPTVAFDIIGTVFSLDRPRVALTDLGAAPTAFDLWFAESLRDAYAWSHAGQYRPLKDVLQAALPRTLAVLGVDASGEDLASVMKAFGELDPVEGAGEAFSILAEAGCQILALTNSSEDSTRRLLERAGLAHRFSAFLSCDTVRTTKPHPNVYAMARERADGEPWMVAAHAWDVAGASVAGMQTAWVSHKEKEYLSVYPEPDVRADDLPAAAMAILSRY
jgi:2-haloacid dehalogenase